jgi:predicted O-methyltransferase YrrM
MLSKIKTLFWYLQQPKGLTLLWMLLKRRTVYAAKENTRTEAEKWCQQNASDTRLTLKQIFPEIKDPVLDLESAFPEEFSYAHEKVKNTPYKMGGQGNITLLYNICEYISAKYVIETGVAYGWSSLSILLSLAKRPGTQLSSTDMPYAKMGNEDYVGIVVNPKLKAHWKLIRESDISGLPKALKNKPYLDLVHYDSDKSYLGRMTTYPKLYDKLRPGGVFISDDINDNLAFKHFCEQQKKQPIIVQFENRFVGVFIK